MSTLTCLIREFQLVMAEYPDEKIETIYVGGGTPTTLSPAQLQRLLDGIHQYLPYDGGEFTFEATPMIYKIPLNCRY